MIAITGLMVIFPAAVAPRDADILGLRLGMDQTEVIRALEANGCRWSSNGRHWSANGIARSQQNGETVTAKSPPVPLQGVKEMKFTFNSPC